MTDATYRVKSVAHWTVIKADSKGLLSVWVTPGWYLKQKTPDGVISLLPANGWRLWRHRIVWGFNRLVDAR